MRVTRRRSPQSSGSYPHSWLSALLCFALTAGVVVLAPLSPVHAGNIANFITFNDYRLSTGGLITDPTGEPGIDVAADISSGLSTGTGTKGSASLSSNGTEMFFRMRVSANPANGANGGFVAQQWLVQLASQNAACLPAGSWCNAVSIGVDGKGNTVDEIYIIMPNGTRKTIIQSTTGTSPTMSVPGTRVQAASGVDGGTDYLLDWQVSIADINMVMTNQPGCGAGGTACTGGTTSYGTITSTTPIRIFYGTSVSNNVEVINKDFMMGGAVCFSGCAGGDPVTVTLSQAKLQLATSAASVVSGPNPPRAGEPSVYDMTLTATNVGGNPLNNISITDAIPAGVTLVSASSASGAISTLDQTMTWTPANLEIGGSASATIRVRVNPNSGHVGNNVTLSSGATGSGVDANTGTATNATSNSVAVGPVEASPNANAAPTATAQSVSTAEDTAKLITLTGTDPEGDAKTFKITSLPDNGTLHRGDGTSDEITSASAGSPAALTGAQVTFVPDANYNGASGNGFHFTVTDVTGSNTASAAAIVTIDVDPVNDSPAATGTTITTASGTATIARSHLEALVSDAETTAADHVITIESLPSVGTLRDAETTIAAEDLPYTVASDATLTYTQPANRAGTDDSSFTYKATDLGDPNDCGSAFAGACAARLSDTGTVTIDITNAAPVVTLSGDNPTSVGESSVTERLYSWSAVDNDGDAVATIQTSCGENGSKVPDSDTANGTNTSGTFKCTFPDGLATSVVSVDAIDGVGNEAAASQNVTVTNVAPTVTITSDGTGETGVAEDFSYTITDPGVDTFPNSAADDRTISCGTDGVVSAESSSATAGTFECTYSSSGTKTVTVTAKDSDGTQGSDTEEMAVAANVGPAITWTDASNVYTVTEHATAERTYLYSASDGNGIVSQTPSVSCGTGGVLGSTNSFDVLSQTGSFSCVFGDGPASPTISVSLVDALGNRAETTHAVDVTDVATPIPTNEPPTASVTLSSSTPKTNDLVEASVVTNDPDDDPLSLRFVWKVMRCTTAGDCTDATTVTVRDITKTPGVTRDSLNLAVAGNGDKGEKIFVEVTPNDGTTDGATDSDMGTVVADTPPTATDRIIKTTLDAPKTVVLEGSDIDGDDVTFKITDQPATGLLQLSSAAPECFLAAGTVPGTMTCHKQVTYTPAEGSDATVTFSYMVENADNESRIATVRVEVEPTVETGTNQTDEAQQETVQGALVSTGTEPTVDDPTETMIVAPRSGRISIIEEPVDPLVTAPSGFSFFGQQVRIEVLDADGEPIEMDSTEPMHFTFLLDSSIIPAGRSISDLKIYRNGVELAACTGGISVVQPLPACILDIAINANGAIQVDVLTIAASLWHFAVPVPAQTGGGSAVTPDPTPTAQPTITPDPKPTVTPDPGHSELPGPLAVLRIKDHTPVRGTMIKITGLLRDCPGHEGTWLHLVAKIDGSDTRKKIAVQRLDERCRTTYRVRANFKKAMFNVIWPQQDDDHKRGGGVAHLVTTHRLPGPRRTTHKPL